MLNPFQLENIKLLIQRTMIPLPSVSFYLFSEKNYKEEILIQAAYSIIYFFSFMKLKFLIVPETRPIPAVIANNPIKVYFTVQFPSQKDLENALKFFGL